MAVGARATHRAAWIEPVPPRRARPLLLTIAEVRLTAPVRYERADARTSLTCSARSTWPRWSRSASSNFKDRPRR
jgi:hypothetical protein